MSGGVDSSVAAALLREEGHDVVGLSMQLYDQREGQIRFGTCCTIDDLHDARRVAHAIGIPHYLVNFQRLFNDTVVANFVSEYAAGRTPIPCVHCNGEMKFATLVERARALDADAVATGHYARVELDEDTRRYVLKRGVDPTRDQSYFLFTLTQAQLACAWFPLGAMHKSEVRAFAGARNLPVAAKRESREICFVPDGDHAGFIERHMIREASASGSDARPSGTGMTPDVAGPASLPVTPKAGVIADAAGRVLGTHNGVHRFTVGQRKGLGVSGREAVYVIELRPETSTVVVGPRDALERHSLTASAVNWISGERPVSRRRVTAQIRYRHREAPAWVDALPDGRARVDFDEPQSAVAPGQAVVFYDGDTVVGGGWIESGV
jgi:tRNA-uridine 2-sulfurtransferase